MCGFVMRNKKGIRARNRDDAIARSAVCSVMNQIMLDQCLRMLSRKILSRAIRDVGTLKPSARRPYLRGFYQLMHENQTWFEMVKPKLKKIVANPLSRR